MTNFEISIQFFLQLALILAVCRCVGLFVRWLGQPEVVGEMIAGVLMGPSLFGLWFPELQAQLFPKPTMPVIYAVSQIGLVLYMFLIGAEFDVALLTKRLSSAISVSLAGILAPFMLGSLVALAVLPTGIFFTDNVSVWQAMLFLGSAMSITAFPMLARIIYTQGLTGTTMGTLALAAGSIDDALAWCLLALVLAGFREDSSIALLAIGGGVLYGVVVMAVLRPLLRRLGDYAERRQELNHYGFVLLLILLMLGAWVTDLIGIYAVFGAFIMGLAMPRGLVTRELSHRIEPLATNFLLPLFFIYSGLNTRIGLVDSPLLWLITLVIIVVACIGKGAACTVAASWSGESLRSALSIGALMNARGLMELILLNIGLERGLITPTLFTIMVIMAIVTTLMATPLFEFFKHAPLPERLWSGKRQPVSLAQD